MNYWYAPVDDSSGKITPRLPPELIAAVAAPWRSTSELEAVQRKAVAKAHYDLAGAAHSVLSSRKQQESQDGLRALGQVQALQQQQQEATEVEAFAAVDSIWAMHVDQLRREASAAIRGLQDKHEDALTKLRLDQVAKAHDTGLRPQRRIKELRDLRRSESVLVGEQNYWGAFQVKAHADVLAAEEAKDAYADWLLKCHNEQEQLLVKQRREVEALRKRLEERLRDLETARDRDLEKLERKIKVANVQQSREFIRERQNFKAAMRGDFLNTRTTRAGCDLANAFPTLAWVAASSPKEDSTKSATPTGTPRSAAATGSQPGSAYLGPHTSDDRPLRRWRGDQSVAANQGVRFAPTPSRVAWAAGSDRQGTGGSVQRSSSVKSGSAHTSGTASSGSSTTTTTSTTTTSTTASTSSSRPQSSGSGGRSGDAQAHEQGGAPAGPDPCPPPRPASGVSERQGDGREAEKGQPEAAVDAKGAPSSAAVGSGTTGAATGSGSSALTEEALRAMNQAMGARPTSGPRGAKSLQSSSFKSNRPYAGGVSACKA